MRASILRIAPSGLTLPWFGSRSGDGGDGALLTAEWATVRCWRARSTISTFSPGVVAHVAPFAVLLWRDGREALPEGGAAVLHALVRGGHLGPSQPVKGKRHFLVELDSRVNT